MSWSQRIKCIIAALCSSFAGSACAEWSMNMPRGVTPISRDIYHLHMTIFWICVAIGVIVFGVMIYALIFHRKSRGHVAAHFHEHTLLEILWAVIPFIILVVMAIPATRVLMAMDNSDRSDVTIMVTGYQWKWKYQYLDEGISFYSNMSTPLEQVLDRKKRKNQYYLQEVDRECVVPINKKIRFLVTSNDVIHSWWVPELGIKRDAIPGFVHEAWARIDKPGVYRGQCAELCGLNHAYMPIVVRAVTDEQYKQWIAEQRGDSPAGAPIEKKPERTDYTQQELMTLGKRVYEQLCVACHHPDGKGQPPVFPALKGSKIATTKANLDEHIKRVLHGVQGTAMQAFAEQLSDAQIAAVVTYERNAWGNNTGDSVSPLKVKSLRNAA